MGPGKLECGEKVGNATTHWTDKSFANSMTANKWCNVDVGNDVKMQTMSSSIPSETLSVSVEKKN